MNIDKFIAKYPPESINIQQLFDVAVFYNKVEDVKYLFQHYKSSIDINNINDMFFNMSFEMSKAIAESIKIGKITYSNITIGKMKVNLIKSKYIPIIVENYTGTINDNLYKKFIDIALESNDKRTIKYLLSLKSHSTIKELVNEYVYVMLLCGSGDNEKLEEYLHIIMEIGDECFETAYLCENFDTIKYLVDKQIRIQNCFLKEKILCDEFLWERNRAGQKNFANTNKHYSCANCG
jgi:hypothetical protein